MTELNDRTTPTTQARSWMLTLPRADYDLASVRRLDRYGGWLGQVELASSGYEHWQVYVEHGTPIAFKTLKNLFPKGHFEPRRSDRIACLRYVSKTDTRLDGPYGSIDPNEASSVSQGKRSDLIELREAVLAGKSVETLMLTDARACRYERELTSVASHLARRRSRSQMRELTTEYLWGKTGQGKTHSVYERFGFDAIYHCSDYRNPFDAYDGQPVLFLDEFVGALPFELLLRILDKYPLDLPARYHNRPALFTTVVIASNVPLERQYPDLRRFEPQRWDALARRIQTVREVVRDE